MNTIRRYLLKFGDLKASLGWIPCLATDSGLIHERYAPEGRNDRGGETDGGRRMADISDISPPRREGAKYGSAGRECDRGRALTGTERIAVYPNALDSFATSWPRRGEFGRKLKTFEVNRDRKRTFTPTQQLCKGAP
jgi:hypothetical protein